MERDLERDTQWMVKTVTMIPKAKEPRAIPIRSPILIVLRPEKIYSIFLEISKYETSFEKVEFY